MTKLREVQLGLTNTQFIDGDRSKRYPKREEFVEEGILFLNAESIKNGTINRNAANFITQQKYSDIKKGRIKNNDILLTTRGNGVGNIAIVNSEEKGLINAQMLILRADDVQISPKFLFYYLSSPTLYSYIWNFASGSAQPQIPIRDLKKIPLFIPKHSIQKKIAAILSAYDDLIENNKCRITLLENMAEEIYREWFVRFRFPGYQQAKFEKGIPVGWSLDSLEKFCLKVTDGTHDTPKPVDDGHYLVTGKNIKNGQVNFDGAYKISKNDHLAISKRSGLKEWDILFSNIGTLGATAIVSANPDYSVKNVIIFKPKSANQSLFLSLVLRNPAVVEDLHLISSGASQQFIGLGVARSFKILNPGDELINNFGEKVLLIQKQILKLNEINQILQSNKEMLLSRLISGKLSVENLDIQFPLSML